MLSLLRVMLAVDFAAVLSQKKKDIIGTTTLLARDKELKNLD